jgi:hypothetical protein
VSLADLAARRFEELGAVPFVVRDVFADSSPGGIEAEVDDFCRRTLGSGIAQAEFFEASVGSVCGLTLQDSRRVVVKAHAPDASFRFLRAVQTIQRHLVADGFPGPEPLVEPTPLGAGVAIVETLLDRGASPDGHDPAVRRVLAAALSRLVERCRPLVELEGLGEHAMTVPPGEVWPTPHDRRFDFVGTAAGAEWIDAIAVRAQRIRDASPGELVVGHSDWRVQHVRFADGDVTAVYDWDSLMLMSEPQAVGSAAYGFTMNWATGDLRLPTVKEGSAFVAEYEEARGRPFSPAERRSARASLVYTMAYTARCEHSDARTDSGRSTPGEGAIADVPPGSARVFLAAHGGELLA